MGGRKPTSFGSARIQIEGQPSSTELIVLSRMLLLICLDGLVQLLLADVAPGADRVAHDLDVEFRHGAKGRAEHEPKTREEIMCERDVAVERGIWREDATIYSVRFRKFSKHDSRF